MDDGEGGRDGRKGEEDEVSLQASEGERGKGAQGGYGLALSVSLRRNVPMRNHVSKFMISRGLEVHNGLVHLRRVERALKG